MDEGWTRWVLEQHEFPYTTLHNADVKAGKLRDRFDVILFADQQANSIVSGNEAPSTRPEYRGGIGEDGVAALKAFVAAGGTLVMLGNACDLAIERFPLPVKNLKRGLTRDQHFAPGTIMRIDVDTAHPLGAGVAAQTYGFYNNSPFFALTEGFSSQQVVGRGPVPERRRRRVGLAAGRGAHGRPGGRRVGRSEARAASCCSDCAPSTAPRPRPRSRCCSTASTWRRRSSRQTQGARWRVATRFSTTAPFRSAPSAEAPPSGTGRHLSASGHESRSLSGDSGIIRRVGRLGGFMKLAVSLPAMLVLLTVVAGGASGPPGPQTPSVPSAAARAARVEQGLLPGVVIAGRPLPVKALAARMADLKVPGVSVAVINGGTIEWARGYGVAETGSATPVTPRTLFQAASISKPVAALGALRLVERGQLSLDQDVNERLTSWKVPENEFTKQEKVTLRRLLSHSAGLTVHGFPGYAADAPVPSLIQVLDGVKPANTAAIRADILPGSVWRYSGGGFTVMQQLVIDVTGRPFPALLADLVLVPVGMTDSTYEQPLPESRRAAAASGHRR